MCSKKLKQCIEENAINAADIKWCPIAVNDGKVVETYFALLIEQPLKEVLDVEKSRKLRDGKIYLPHFIYAKVKDVDLFALEDDDPNSVFISDRLKQIIEAKRLKGDGSASFYDPQNGKTRTFPKGSYTDWNY